MLYVALKKDFLENSCILSCFVQLKSILFNLLCVFDFFHSAGSQLLFRLILFSVLRSLPSAAVVSQLPAEH